MDETLELLSIIATALFGTSIGTKKVVEDVVVPKSWFEHYLKIMETTDQHVVWNKTSEQNFRRQVQQNRRETRTLTTQTSDIGPPKSCSTPTTKQVREWYNDHNRIEGQPKKVLIEEVNPTAPRADNTFVDLIRQVRFKMPNTSSQHNSGQKIETINPYPILFVSPPDKFDPKRTDVRQWIKDFDMFIESNNINSQKLNIVIAHLDHETRKIIENSQFSLNEDTAYAELKTLLSQLYGRKTTPNLELKR
ncbi:hypothetical protein BpHYR1_052032 [Brachionus plicatilis]|uniref:Uncharacterized protein n=1 Tax=Brachionus plicatilis TaxID=10195 RepID=A0A3M7Q005_BRAPC|nr:hypothetical protein BpHYR1_052032 [Brachionus plicatilis]